MSDYFYSDFYKSITFYIGEASTWVVASLLICVAFFVAKSLLKSNRNKMMATNKSLLVSSFIVWILGLVIYTLGFYKEGHSVFAVMPRAVTAAFKMFVASDELGEVLDPLKEDSVYLLFFSIIHFAAAIISVIFIINLLGFRIKSAISLYATRWFRKKYDVVNNGTNLYNHQYMQNIFAARSEGYTTYLTYKGLDLLDNNYNFIIPVYENMPEQLSVEPGTIIIKPELNEKVQLTGDNVYVRNKPTTAGTILATLKKYTIVTRIEKNSSYANGYYWDKVKLSDGTVGYIVTKYLSTTIVAAISP